MQATPHSTSNRILGHLPREDLDRLIPHLERVELEPRQKLAGAHQVIDHVYFMESGFASVVTSVRNDIPVEVGIAGREGIANLPALLGSDQMADECMVQVAGRCLRLPADHARTAMEESASFNRAVRQYAYLFMMQASSTILANARATVSRRLARWLLMARDRLDDDAMPLTHEFISFMLGVRRPGVTLALAGFEDAGWITRQRGQVNLIDRPALLSEANGFYGPAEQEFERLLGSRGQS